MKYTDYKFFANFETSPYSIDERGILVDDFSSSLGLLNIAFSSLESEIEKLIHKLLGINSEVGEILTAEVSFKNKVFLTASLMKKMKDSIKGNIDPQYLDPFIDEFIKMLLKCEELRNQLTHSIYISNNDSGAVRIKVTAKTDGHKRKEEVIETSYVLDVYDFIVSTRIYIEDLSVNE